MCNRKLVLMFFVLMMAGCVTENIDSDARTPEDTENGIVVLSLTKSGFDPWLVEYDYRQLDGEAYGTLEMVGNRKGQIDSDFAEISGNLLAVELPAGEYEIYRWTIRRWLFSRQSDESLGIQFSVAPGKITYIGQLNLDTGPHLVLENGIRNVYTRVIGSAGRDMRYTQKLFPQIDFSRFKIRIMVEKYLDVTQKGPA